MLMPSMLEIRKFFISFVSAPLLAGSLTTPLAAQEIAAPQAMYGRWQGSDGLVYSIGISAPLGTENPKIQITAQGKDQKPTVKLLPGSPLRVSVIRPLIATGLTYLGEFDPKGFDVRATCRISSCYYPKAVPVKVGNYLRNNHPNLSSRMQVESVSSNLIIMNRHVVRISWEQGDKTDLRSVVVNESVEVKEIRLFRELTLQGFLSLTDEQIAAWMDWTDASSAEKMPNSKKFPVIQGFSPKIADEIFRLAYFDGINAKRLVRDLAFLSDRKQRASRLRDEVENRRILINAITAEVAELRSLDGQGPLAKARMDREMAHLRNLRAAQEILRNWSFWEAEGYYPTN